jgi:hypothetical protein
LLAAYGVPKAAPATVAAPELPLLRWRFRTRPNLTMGDLAQQARLTKLVISRDNRKYWLRVNDRSQYPGDNLYLVKIQFHPGQLLYGETDREATEAKRHLFDPKRMDRLEGKRRLKDG